MTDWCILRTQGRHTLRLAETLATDGYEVWTPVETKRVKGRDQRKPIMPGYVFAKDMHLVDLFERARLPAVASFHVLRSQTGKVEMAHDWALDGLRGVELKHTPRRLRPQLIPVGSSVKVSPTHGSFGGLVGQVEDVTPNGQAIVCFNGRFVVKIPTFLLNLDDVYEPAKALAA